MNRWIGPVVMGVGAVVLVVGVIGLGGSDSTEAANTTTSTSAVATDSTTTTGAASTSTTAAETTSTSTSTTTTSSTTTTTEAPETVEEFVKAFAAALEAGDREFVSERLHPVVSDAWGDDLCQAWIDREIVELRDYTLVAVTSGPADASVTTPGGQVSVADMYEADVTFTFQGQSFDSVGTFAPIDGMMYWLGQCR
ncbi:MAG: hypothetical protein KDB69_00350 [Acidimicrobiia bacterium]|nr:hypothetical protein [Acidimicrobiia bacterium]